MTTDIAQGWVANSPSPMPGDVAESAPVVPTVSAGARNDTSPTLIWMLFSKQVLSIHLPAPLTTAKKEFLPLCSLPLITRVRVSPVCLCFLLT